MYHYLKWAALGLFLRRNVRNLLLIGVGVLGIFVADAVYEDMADYAARAGETHKIGTYLLLKWLAVALFGGLILFSARRLGFASKSEEERRAGTKGRKEPSAANDPIMKRLEKFRTPERLRHRSDLILQRRRKKR